MQCLKSLARSECWENNNKRLLLNEPNANASQALSVSSSYRDGVTDAKTQNSKCATVHCQG